MKFSFNFLPIITLIKERPERIILWSLLATFVFLGFYLVLSGLMRRDPFFPEEMMVKEINDRPVTKAVAYVDFEDLLARKPFTYYSHIIQRNPFVRRLPGVIELVRDDERVVVLEPVVGLIYRGIIRTPEGPVAFIEGREATHWARKGDEVEGWKIIKIGEEEVKLYNEERKKELILPLGGGPEERERARREAEERRRRREGRQPERPGRERFEIPPGWEELLPELPPARERRRR